MISAFGHLDQRCVDAEAALALHARFRRQIRQPLEGGDELRPAIGIAAVVDCIDADKDVETANHLGPRKGQREKHRIASGNIRNGNAVCHRVLRAIQRHGDVGGKSAAAEGPQVEIEHALFHRPERRCHAPAGLHLDEVTLTISDRQRMAAKAFLSRHGEGRRRIQSAAQQDHGVSADVALLLTTNLGLWVRDGGIPQLDLGSPFPHSLYFQHLLFTGRTHFNHASSPIRLLSDGAILVFHGFLERGQRRHGCIAKLAPQLQ